MADIFDENANTNGSPLPANDMSQTFSAMASEGHPIARQYRPARPISYQLREHCVVYFEEKLHHHALNLLLSIVSSGASGTGPIFVPPPQQLALAATFVVHPSTTTRPKTTEAEQIANSALQLLRLTNVLVGPVAARFDVAFTFTHFDISRHGGRFLGDKEPGTSKPVTNDDTEPLNSEFARIGSLWSRSEDFWQAVGWAFNCSVLHEKRWARWKLWLEFMCDVLEADWKERRRQVEDARGKLKPDADPEAFKASLIFKYISSTSGITGRRRRIMRAIFADGSASALSEFREIFYNELKELDPNQDRPQKRQVDVNVNEDIYGDYLSPDEDEEPEEDPAAMEMERERERPSRPKRLRITRSNALTQPESDEDLAGLDGVPSHNTAQIGDLEALNLRQRLLQLLSGVVFALPEDSRDFVSLPDLYRLFAEFIRHLPLPTFQLLVSPSILTGFLADAQTTLCETLLFELLENSAPDSQENYISQHKLETCFLPYAASKDSVVDNAKVSILLESLMRLLDADGHLIYSPSLAAAVKDGIERRAERCRADKKSQARQRAEEAAWSWIFESGHRMMFMLRTIEDRDAQPMEPDPIPPVTDCNGSPAGAGPVLGEQVPQDGTLLQPESAPKFLGDAKSS